MALRLASSLRASCACLGQAGPVAGRVVATSLRAAAGAAPQSGLAAGSLAPEAPCGSGTLAPRYASTKSMWGAGVVGGARVASSGAGAGAGAGAVAAIAAAGGTGVFARGLRVKVNYDLQQALSSFETKCLQEGIEKKIKARRYHLKPTVQRRLARERKKYYRRKKPIDAAFEKLMFDQSINPF